MVDVHEAVVQRYEAMVDVHKAVELRYKAMVDVHEAVVQRYKSVMRVNAKIQRHIAVVEALQSSKIYALKSYGAALAK